MEEGHKMYAATLEKGSYISLRDRLSNSDFSDKQALVIERAVANLHNFDPSYWFHEFSQADFTPEQASLLVALFTKRAVRGE